MLINHAELPVEDSMDPPYGGLMDCVTRKWVGVDLCLGAEITRSQKNCLKITPTPTCRVHALLGPGF